MKIDERRVFRWLIAGFVLYKLSTSKASPHSSRLRDALGGETRIGNAPDDGLRGIGIGNPPPV